MVPTASRCPPTRRCFPLPRSPSVVSVVNDILAAEEDQGEEWDDARKVALLQRAILLFEQEASGAATARVRRRLKESAASE